MTKRAEEQGRRGAGKRTGQGDKVRGRQREREDR